jgi:hypothetical protein
MREELLPIVKDPAAYARTISIGFGVWIDLDWRNRGWNVEDPSKNFYSPEALEASVRAALEAADEYVWIYSETPRWWTDEGPPLKIPEAYAEALRRAKGP